MAIKCPNDGDQYFASKRPHSNGGTFENARNEANPINEKARFEQERIAEQTERTQLTEAIQNEIGTDTTIGVPLDKTSQAELVRLAKRETALFNRSIAGQEARWDKARDAINRIMYTTVGKNSKMLDFITSATRKFLNSDADFNQWALLNFGTEGRQSLDNPLVRARTMSEPKIHAKLQKYTQFMERTVGAEAEPIAKRLGYEIPDLLEAVGHYANAEHASERNALLLARWRGELVAERLASDGDLQRIVALERQIKDLETNLENLNPSDGLLSGGYTDAQARELAGRILRDTGLTEAEASSLSQRMRDVYNEVQKDMADAGLITPEQVGAFPAFERYVPYKTKFDNTTGPINDTHVYNPGQFRAIDGKATPPDSAYLTIMHYATRAASAQGMQEFGIMLNAAYKKALADGRDVGLRRYDYSRLQREANSSNRNVRQHAENILRGEKTGGVVVDIPEFDAEGNHLETRRQLLTFDANWSDPEMNLSGVDLARAMIGPAKASEITQFFGNATSMYSQLFTRLNPPFGPINGNRDVIERSVNMVGREFYDTNGNTVHGASLVGLMLANLPRAFKVFRAGLHGADPNTEIGRMFLEYQAAGLHQEYTPGMKPKHRTLSDVLESREGKTFLQKHGMGAFQTVLDKMAAPMRKTVLKVLDTWNDYFNNIAPVSQYMTLREAGISADSAGASTLEMFNLYQTGTATRSLRALYPFVKPTMQTVGAMGRTLGLAPNARGQFRPNARGIASVVGGTAAMSMLLPLIKDQMGYDEDTGLSHLDQLSLSQLQRFVPIGTGDGNFFKMPTGFGIPQIVMTAAFGWDRVQRGVMTPSDFTFEMLFSVAKNVTPTAWPEFSFKAKPMEWLTHAFAPTLVSPIVEVATNTAYHGGTISYADSRGMKSKAMQGSLNTERGYHKMARSIQETMGIDWSPEQVKSLINGFGSGMLRIIGGLIEDDALKKSGTAKTANQELGPWLRAMGLSIAYGKAHDLSKNHFYRANDAYVKRIKDANIPITDTSYGNNAAKKEVYQRGVLKKAGWDKKDIDDFINLQAAQTALRKSNTKFNKEIKPIWMSADDSIPIRKKFEQLAKDQQQIYTDVVNKLNYYSRSR